MKFKAGAAAAALVFAQIALASAPAQAKVLAKVNGAEITDEDVKTALDDLGPNLPMPEGVERDVYVLDYLIDLKLAARQAEADKIADTPEFKRRMAYQRDKGLMEGLLGKIAEQSVTDEALKKVYDDAAKGQGPQPEVHARHILVASEDEAKAALRRVKGGEDFAKVADEVSKDPGSKGGDLGWFTKDRMVPEFADAAFALKVGQISDPVKSQFGWHVIKLEERREKSFPAFDSVKDQVKSFVMQKAQTDEIMKLRAAAKIEKTPDAPVAPAAK